MVEGVGERRQFPPYLPRELEVKAMTDKKTEWRRQSETLREVEKIREIDRLVDAAEISEELAKWRRFQQKKTN